MDPCSTVKLTIPRGLRRFLLRGVAKVQGEWTLWCLTHNLRKIAQALQTKPAVRQRLAAL